MTISSRFSSKAAAHQLGLPSPRTTSRTTTKSRIHNGRHHRFLMFAAVYVIATFTIIGSTNERNQEQREMQLNLHHNNGKASPYSYFHVMTDHDSKLQQPGISSMVVTSAAPSPSSAANNQFIINDTRDRIKFEKLKEHLRKKSSLRRAVVKAHQQGKRRNKDLQSVQQQIEEEENSTTPTKQWHTKDATTTRQNTMKAKTKRPPVATISGNSTSSTNNKVFAQIFFGALAKRITNLQTQKQQLQTNKRAGTVASVSHQKMVHHIHNRLRATENPIFVLSLPGSASLTTSKYFQCGLNSRNDKDVAFYWTHKDYIDSDTTATVVQHNNHTITTSISESSKHRRSTRIAIGKCIQDNVLANQSNPLQNCGTAHVWTSMGYLSPTSQQCFFPQWNTRAMAGIANSYPNATYVLVSHASAEDWYETSTTKFKQNIAQHCSKQPHYNNDDGDSNSSSNGHRIPMDPKIASKHDWMEFYEWHRQAVRNFMNDNPQLHFVDISLEATNTSTILYKEFGLSKHCWMPPPASNYEPFNTEDTIQDSEWKSIQNQLPSPILVVSLPKSGTTSTQRFFQCGLGRNAAGHQWFFDEQSEKYQKIGKCIQNNIVRNNNSMSKYSNQSSSSSSTMFFEGCGNFSVWTDAGYLDDPISRRKNRSNQPSPGCFFPTMHDDALDAFYRAHPNGTIINVLRNPIDWYESARKWRRLTERMSKQCTGFPPPKSSRDEWVSFYNSHSQHVRNFVQQHSSLTFVEVSLESETTGQQLQDRTGIPSSCWGDCNPDKSKGTSCGVLKHESKKRQRQLLLPQQRRKFSSSSTNPQDQEMHRHEVEKENPETLKWMKLQRKFDRLRNIPVNIKQENGNHMP